MPYLISPVLRSQIISRSLASNRHHQHKLFPQTFSVFNPWEGPGNSNAICFSPKSHGHHLELRAGMPWGRKGLLPRPEQRHFHARSTRGSIIPQHRTQSLLLPCPGAVGAGRQDLGSSPRNTVTDPDSEREQPCPSCGCFPERSDLALSKTVTPRNHWNSGITCFPFAQFQVFNFLFLF